MTAKKKIITSYLAAFVFISTAAVEYNKTDEGFPVGLISDCNGSWKPAKLKPESLKQLYLVLVGDGGVSSGNWTMYNYYHAKYLPRHPDFDFKKKTFLYVGGYLDSTNWRAGLLLGNLYKKLGYNVLLLDSLNFTTIVSFPLAARLMREVGKHTAEMLATLTKLGLDPKTLEVTGVSLGGETMSFIAKNYRRITGQNISTLVALDPGGPCFRHLGPDQRLDQSDADFVVSIITNSEGFGLGIPVGHASFYVNGGERQPGEFWWFPCDVACSHIRSYFLWLAALANPGGFIGVRCKSVDHAKHGDCFDEPLETNTMDVMIDKSKPGIYYLATSNRYPYFLGKEGLQKKDGQHFPYN